MGRPADVPAYEPDLYSTQAIVDPHPHYARLRRLGPVVWLTKQRVYALPRYAQCKAVLRDDTTFVSGEGVGLNRIFNRLSRGTTLNSDGDEHDQRRKLVAHRLLPRALRTMSDVVTRQAEQLVAEAVRRQHVDGVDGSGDRAAAFRGARSRRLAEGPPPAPAAVGRSHIRCAWPAESLCPQVGAGQSADAALLQGRRAPPVGDPRQHGS